MMDSSEPAQQQLAENSPREIFHAAVAKQFSSVHVLLEQSFATLSQNGDDLQPLINKEYINERIRVNMPLFSDFLALSIEYFKILIALDFHKIISELNIMLMGINSQNWIYSSKSDSFANISDLVHYRTKNS